MDDKRIAVSTNTVDSIAIELLKTFEFLIPKPMIRNSTLG